MMLFWQVWSIQSASNFFKSEIRFSQNSWKANLKHSKALHVDWKKNLFSIWTSEFILFFLFLIKINRTSYFDSGNHRAVSHWKSPPKHLWASWLFSFLPLNTSKLPSSRWSLARASSAAKSLWSWATSSPGCPASPQGPGAARSWKDKRVFILSEQRKSDAC